MSPLRSIGPTCTVHHCTRPVRRFGHLCGVHWDALSAAQRAALRWGSEQPTEPLDSLEVLWLLPSGDDGPSAA